MEDSPLLHLLGRRGAWPVLAALQNAPSHSIRSLAHTAQHPVATVARIVTDLEAMGAVETLRPGRDKRVTWRSGPAADWLRALAPPEIRAGVAVAFQQSYEGPGIVQRWMAPGDILAQPSTKTRIVVLTTEEDDALDEVGPALDQLEAQGWPAPEVTVQDPGSLGDDDVARAMLQPIASTM